MLSLLVASDIAAAGCAWLIAYYARFFAAGLGLPVGTELSGGLPAAVLISLAACVPVFATLGLYEPKRIKTLWAEGSVIVRAVVVAWGLMYVIVSLADPVEHGRFVMISELAAWLVLAVLNRVAGRIVLRQLRAGLEHPLRRHRRHRAPRTDALPLPEAQQVDRHRAGVFHPESPVEAVSPRP